MNIDLSSIETSILTLAGTAISVFGSIALARLAQRFGIQVSAGQKAAFDLALSDSISYGVTKADTAIKANGWDQIDSKNAIVDAALPYMIARFPDALKSVGLTPDMADPANKAVIEGALQRMLPQATSNVVNSPVTPAPPPGGTGAPAT